jgi:hypothetical protein
LRLRNAPFETVKVAAPLSGLESGQFRFRVKSQFYQTPARQWSDHYANVCDRTFVKSILLILNIKDLLDIA